MNRDACLRILDEYAELRGPFDEAMVLVAESVRSLHDVARDLGAVPAPTSVAERLERVASMLQAASTLLSASGDGPNARLSTYVERQKSLVKDLLAVAR